MTTCGVCKGVYVGREAQALQIQNGQLICTECVTLTVLFEQTIRAGRLIRNEPLGDIFEITTESTNKMNGIVKKYGGG